MHSPTLARALAAPAATLLAFGFSSLAFAAAPAVISNVQVAAVGSTTATITWQTDQPADSQVFYGETASYDASSAYDSTATTSHVAYLGGLVPSSTYHFDVASNDGAGLATSSDMTLTTLAAGASQASSTPLALLGIDSIKSTATADGSYSDGWEWVFHFLVPNNEPMLSLLFSDFTGAGTIAAGNHIRYYSAASSNATSSDSAMTIGSANAFGGALDFTSAFANSTTTGDTQVDITVDAAVPAGTPAGSYSASWTALSTTTP